MNEAVDHERLQSASPRTGLRLLCLLVQMRWRNPLTPGHTLRPMPPRVCGADSHATNGPRRWDLEAAAFGVESGTGLYLRETHATRPTSEVLERCARYWPANALRPDPRTLRAGGVSHG